MLGWEKPLDAVRDSRRCARIQTPQIVRGLVVMFLCRLGSLNALVQTRQSRFWKHWLGGALPSADTLGRVSDQIDPDDVRGVIRQLYATCKRNKALRHERLGLMAAVLDGHESHTTYRRRCAGCLERRVKTVDGEQVQYYHRHIALRLVMSDDLEMMLDVEPQRPGEDEVAAAIRLLDRALPMYPRAFDVVIGDALYCRADFFNYLRAHGKHAMAVLKDENRDLLEDARALFPTLTSVEETEGRCHRTCWDAEGFTTWPQVHGSVRVVQSVERNRVTRQLDGVEEEILSEWFWATTLPKAQAGTGIIVRLGHSRWHIENQGFNELVNQWHADHIYKHQPTAILVLWLLTMLCLNVFIAFYRRNLKSPLRRAFSMLHISRCLSAELLADLPLALAEHPP